MVLHTIGFVTYINLKESIMKAKMTFVLIMIFGILIAGCSKEDQKVEVKDEDEEILEPPEPQIYETFTFSSNGTEREGKIYLPAAYDTNKSLPAIYLIDFEEQHYPITTDEFEKVINGVQQIEGFDALVVSLESIPGFDAKPNSFQDHYEIYKNMTTYVDGKYTNNPSRTFIGKGSESGVVMMALFLENQETSVFDNFIATDPSPLYTSAIIELLETNNFPQNKLDKKLHFSFSTTNDPVKCTELIYLIYEAHYPWLQFESIEYTKSDYENTYPISYAAGIKFIFE